MSSITHLGFTSATQAEAALIAAGYEVDDRSYVHSNSGWGPIIEAIEGGECVLYLYDCESLHSSLQQYQVPPPATPNNVRAGE